jgi:hypothetical protein
MVEFLPRYRSHRVAIKRSEAVCPFKKTRRGAKYCTAHATNQNGTLYWASHPISLNAVILGIFVAAPVV